MLTAMLITDNDRFSVFEQAQTVLAGALVLIVALALLFLADPVHRMLGSGGANVVRRVMGMILVAIAVKMMLTGGSGWLGLPKPQCNSLRDSQRDVMIKSNNFGRTAAM